MAFDFMIATDEIREKMYGFLKPVYKDTLDFDVHLINWNYGVFDDESGYFITNVKLGGDDRQYILINREGTIFSIVADRYRYTFSEIPDALLKDSEMIQEGLKLCTSEKLREYFEYCLSAEQKADFERITEQMRDRCRPSASINSYEDAEKLFYQNDCNYYRISHFYNKKTLENFDKYMTAEQRGKIMSSQYKSIISKIVSYDDNLSEEEYKSISRDFGNAQFMIIKGLDDLYEDITFSAIKKAYHSGVVSAVYTAFIEKYIVLNIRTFPERIDKLRPLLDFINENMTDKNFRRLDFCRKELEKLVYQESKGFQFILSTDEIREKMYEFLKPKKKSAFDNDTDGINWTTGVYDKESGIFLTRIYYLSDGIARCGVNYYSYIVITDWGEIFQVENNDEYEKKTYYFSIPRQYQSLSEKVKEGIGYFEKHDFSFRENLSEETKGRLKSISEKMKDKCKQNYQILCEDDAKELFIRNHCYICNILRGYNKDTADHFSAYISYKKLCLWDAENQRRRRTN